MSRWLALLPCLCLAACATHRASVDHRMLLPQGGDRIELEPQQVFVMPIPLAQPEPEFPQSMKAGMPVEIVVCAEIWLSEDGDVAKVTPFEGSQDCASDMPQVEAYARSVDAALRRWEFTPAMICDFPPQAIEKRERGDCTGPEVAVRRVPVRLNYAFTFSSRDGKRRVGMVRTPSAGDVPRASSAAP